MFPGGIAGRDVPHPRGYPTAIIVQVRMRRYNALSELLAHGDAASNDDLCWDRNV